MTEINPEPMSRELKSSRLLVLFFPVISAGLGTIVVAMVAALAGFHRDLMLVVAAGIGAVLAVPAVFLLYRQRVERAAASRRLQNVEARVGGIVESAMDAVITIDAGQRVVQFNAAAERAFRWPRSAVIGRKIDLLIPERFRATHGAHVERFGRTATTSRGMGAQTVLYGLRADGEEFPIEASISQHVEDDRKFFTVILRDITLRLRSEQELAGSEARLRGILDSAMDAIITVDESQRVVLFNKAAEEVFRCPREEAVGARLDGFIPERFRAGHRRMVADFGDTAAASRRMGHARVVMGLRRNGEEFPIEASISQVSEHGQRFFTVILRDVTERVRNERALEQSREELREFAEAANSVREQEKSRIARELHDELGQALTALKIDLGWLREHLGPADEGVRAKLAAMQAVVDGTVAAARRISADLRPLMLDDLGLLAACEWLTNNFVQRTGVRCELVVSGEEMDLPEPYATAIFRALQESLTNAARHAEATQVEVTLERDGGEIVLCVIDNGMGFDTGEIRRPGSFGLIGLRERAYLLGGRVSVESSTRGGTRVELRVPAPPQQGMTA